MAGGRSLGFPPMSGPERAGRRSRAWLAVLALPLVLVAGLAGGPLVALLAAAAGVQVVVVWRGAPGAAASLAGALEAGWAGASWAGGRVGSAVAVVAVRVVPAMVGALAVLVALDWGIGAAWDRGAGGSTVNPSAALSLASRDLPPAHDDRIDSPALAGAAWADRYFAEMEALPITYEPFLGPRELPVHGRHINSSDGVRASYEPAGVDGEEAVEVWFLGGSTLWGEGQRDVHTIPSEVARLAERDGIVLRAVNLGARGYTAFQEYLVFESELARRPAPDLAVFYHGANEAYSLLEAPGNLGSQPSIYQLEVYEEAFRRALTQPDQQPLPEPSVLEDYRDTGIVNRVLRRARDAVERPAGAQDGPYQPTVEAIRRANDEAAQIYRRSVRLIHHEAAAHDVPVALFWQPGFQAPASDPGPDRYAQLGRRVATFGGGIDISDALRDPPSPVLIDGLHTNELGARLSAEAMWPHLEPMVRAR